MNSDQQQQDMLEHIQKQYSENTLLTGDVPYVQMSCAAVQAQQARRLAEATERQAAALERIATVLENRPAEKWINE